MFAENSKMQEELCVVGDKGKIETGVPASIWKKLNQKLE